MSVFDTFNGLPTHALVVHAAVVGVPVAALATVAAAVRPAWARRFRWWVVALDVLVYATAFVAKESGERLFARLSQPQVAQAHANLGATLPFYALGLVAVALLLALAHRRAGAAPRWAAVGVAVLAVAAGGAAATQVVRVGDSGATAVWGQTVTATNHR